MNKPARKIEWLVWGGLVLIITVIAGAYAWSKLGASGRPLPVLAQLPDFTLTNQNNEPVSLASLRGQVWIADIIFVQCPVQCAKMTRRLAELQAVLPANQPVRLVSFTSYPEHDTPQILKKYASQFGADSHRWWFLTGDRREIRRLAVNDFKFVVVEKKPEEREVPEDLFIHSTYAVLVDQKGQVRGWTDRDGRLHAYFDLLEDPEAKSELLSATRQLLRKPSL